MKINSSKSYDSCRGTFHTVNEVELLALRAVVFALALAAFLPAASAQLASPPAPALLAPAQGNAPAAALATARRGVLRSQFRGLDRAVIQQLGSKQVTRVRLPMFGHGERILNFTGREDYGPGRFALTGTLEGISPSSAVLAVWDGAVTLDAHGHAENDVRLRSAGQGVNGGYWLEEADPAAQGVCGVNDSETAPLMAPAVAGNAGPGGITSSLADGNLYADLLAYYTPLARDAAGGDAQMSSLIAARVAIANSVHSFSGTLFRIRLVRISLMDYSVVTTASDLLTKLGTTDDGVMDGVSADIAEFGADLIHLWATYTDVSNNGIGNAPGAFGVNRWDQPPQTFTHESGHNLGCLHQTSGGVNNATNGIIEHAWEATYEFSAIETARAQTIMWGSSEPTRIDAFSDPNATFTFSHWILPSSPPIPIGVAGSADNAQFIRTNRFVTVRRKEPRFYVSPGADGQATPHSPANNLTSVYDTWYHNTWGQTATNPVVVRVAAGNIPAPARISTRSRLEKWGGGSNARIAP